MLITCKTCGCEFKVFPSRLKLGMVKYCSMKCYQKEGDKNPFYAKQHTEESIEKMASHPNRPRFKVGESNPNYLKPEGVSYVSIHRKVNRLYAKTVLCEHCLKLKKLEWANISGKYLIERSDWLCLCRSCHKKFDVGSGRSGRKEFKLF